MHTLSRILPFILVLFLLSVFSLWAGDTQPDYENPKALAELIETGTPEYLLVDVRTPGEYNSGHIPTAVNIPVSEIAAEPPETEKERLIIVYCRSGSRSNRAAGILESLGYKRVFDFGGIYRWEGDLSKVE